MEGCRSGLLALIELAGNQFFIDVAPHPIFAGLERFNDWVARGVIVLGGVFVHRMVTAADVTADHANAQLDPSAAGSETFLAAGILCRNRSNLIDMVARIGDRWDGYLLWICLLAHGCLLMVVRFEYHCLIVPRTKSATVRVTHISVSNILRPNRLER